ncbi:MAG: hypothetical protein ACQET5_00195 [Halobacteriota archaeon]|uniref:hypothetical protein n=1 Tax=Natronomonas sp. TaxID=2184060 RepID=UPI00397610D2
MSDEPAARKNGDRDPLADDPFAQLDGDDIELEVDADALFEEMEVSPLDDEAVWAAIETEEEEEAAGETAADPSGEPPEAVVPKERYCTTCEHFSEPPNATCRNPGTEIVELVGVDSFRVRNCPIVERRREDAVFSDGS